MYSFFAKNMCKSMLVCLYIIIMNRNGNIVSVRPKSSVDSVQERFLFILSNVKEILTMRVLLGLLDGVCLGLLVYTVARPQSVARLVGWEGQSEEGGEE